MKVMDKATILEERMVESVLHERFMLAKLNYPLVVGLHFATQNDVDLFLIVDLMLGGDLRYHMKSGRPFEPERVRFYAAQTALAINYLHESGYIHRDIKPDNLLLDGQGNVHITDFNLSVRRDDMRRRGVVGTRSYMAPEIISRQKYDEAVDWWALGVCIYEWTFSTVPFSGSSDEQRHAVMRSEPSWPNLISKDAKSLISGLLKKDPKKRLNWEKIKAHPYFAGMDWKKLEDKSAEAPWKPDTTRANCDGAYDLDEQFQVKKKRPPVLDDSFSPWDWLPGKSEDSSAIAPSDGSTESDAISNDRSSANSQAEEAQSNDDGETDDSENGGGHTKSNTRNTASARSTVESIPAADATESGKKAKKPKQKAPPAAVVEHSVEDIPANGSPAASPEPSRKKHKRSASVEEVSPRVGHKSKHDSDTVKQPCKDSDSTTPAKRKKSKPKS